MRRQQRLPWEQPQLLRQERLPLLQDWQSQTVAGFLLLVFLWLMPCVPGFLRWLILLALPCLALWQTCEQVQQGHWFATSHLLAWWLLLAVVFMMHRTYDKGLFGKRR